MSVNGVLENSYIRASYSTENAGFKFDSLRTLEHEWLFKRQGLPSASDFDSCFTGGMEFIFPSDCSERFAGLDYPDHGYLWHSVFKTDIGKNNVTATAVNLPWGINVTICASLNGNCLTLVFLAENSSNDDFHYIWRLHAAFAGDNIDRVHYGGGTVFLEHDGQNAAYCDFSPKIFENKYPAKTMLPFELETPASYPNEFFCHIAQNRGQTDIFSQNMCLSVTYTDSDPFLTVYSRLYDEGRAVIIEPSDTAGSSLAYAQKNRSIRYIPPRGVIRRRIDISIKTCTKKNIKKDLC